MRSCLIMFVISECYCLLLHEMTTSPSPPLTSSVLTDKHYNFLLDLLAEEKQLRQQLQRTVIQQEEDLKNITNLLSQFHRNGEALLLHITTGKSAVQSSDYHAASDALDGSLDSFSHTFNETNPWWRLDLDGIYNIERVEIYNRANCCPERLHSLRVTIGMTESNSELCGHFAGPGTNGQHIILQCPEFLNGRYVKIMIYNPNGFDVLSLAEVKVYAKL